MISATENTNNAAASWGDLQPVPNLNFADKNSAGAIANKQAEDAYLVQLREKEREDARAHGDQGRLDSMAEADRIMHSLK